MRPARVMGAVVLAGVVLRARASDAETLRIASKAFTESVVLAEVAAQLERAAGFDVDHRAGLGGSRLVWDALVSGAIDVYPEYTGTLLDEILPASTSASTTAGPEGLAAALAAHGVGMTAPLGFNNTYAVGLLTARARALGVAKISDLRAHPDIVLGLSNEFMSRHDGWPALQQRYGLPQAKVRGLDHDLAYRALGSGAIDATDLYTTDAEIQKYGLLPLADDLRFFKRYDAVLLYRLDVVSRFGPGALQALRRLEGRVDEAAMIALNARAKLDRLPPADVAADFVRATFAVTAPRARTSAARMILARVVEHLWLVGVSLLAAILVAVPLGVAAARRRRLGQVVLAAVGVVQTLPTLALLVFMIPLFGIGTVPAIVALFLYGLLPIVRNTHAGLTGIPGALRESAAALGLSRGARAAAHRAAAREPAHPRGHQERRRHQRRDGHAGRAHRRGRARAADLHGHSARRRRPHPAGRRARVAARARRAGRVRARRAARRAARIARTRVAVNASPPHGLLRR